MKKIIYILIFLVFSADIIAENLLIETKHRRRYDEIHVEIWLKSGDLYSPFISSAKFHLKYDSSSLIPIDKLENITDSISDNINQVNPIIDIISPINSSKGLSNPQIFSINSAKSEVILGFTRTNNLMQGIKVDNNGFGTFITKLKFRIRDSVNTNSSTGISWNVDSTALYDDTNKEISDKLSYKSMANFKVIGITLLSPILENAVIDRDKNYACLTGSYSGKGYPIYFERSIDPAIYKIPTLQKLQIDNDLAYSLELNTGNGEWVDFGRFVESDFASSTVINNNLHYTGKIGNPNSSSTYILSTYKGSKLDINNFRLPVRFLISKELSYKIRYDKLFLRLRKLEGNFGKNLDNWSLDTIQSEEYGPMSAGRIFSLHLNGKDEYLKTDDNISNSTQLTVEAWINLNLMKSEGANPGIVVSSGGEEATPINGSKEGSWMLYLKDGKYPAFRVREIDGRGRNGYLAELYDHTINQISKDSIFTYNYDLNWNHIAATVNNNEVTLYINGIIVDKFINDSAIDTRMLVTNHPIWIGLNPNNKIEANNFFGGAIKSVRLWKIALSQDEIKKYAMGLHDPINTQQFDDIRRGLILYYSLNGELNDLASDVNYQQGNQSISFYKSKIKQTSNVAFKPDFPHIRITSPLKYSGLLNVEKVNYRVNWIGYEIGDISKINSKDIDIEYSIDGGFSWTGIKDSSSRYQNGTNSPDMERLWVTWQPYLNNDQNANLRSADPPVKNVFLRISGTTANGQKDAYFISDTIKIAQYFALYKGTNTVIKTDASNTINFLTNRNMLELWIKPYRFATANNYALPLISKVDSVSGEEFFSLKLLHNGLLEFKITDNKNTIRKAISDINYPLIEANSIAIDSPWTHIAVYFDYDRGNGQSFIRFYIDGFPQNDSSITNQLGAAFIPKNSNKANTYFCSYPNVKSGKLGLFKGEFKEFRFWSDLPANIDYGNDLDALTLFIQGSLSNRISNLSSDVKKSLISAISFNGGTGVSNEIRILTSDYTSDFYLKFHNDSAIYYPTKPYIKVVEPIYRQRVSNKSEELRLRWVGFDYSSIMSDISVGALSNPPVVEYSLFGGGGDETQPYKYVGSTYWPGNKITSLSIPNNSLYKFYGLTDSVVYALNVNVSQANPDKNNDGKYSDQGALPATLTNARFRLTLKYRLFNTTDIISSESSLFTINPGSNFTLRLIPEGYYDGKNYPLRQIASSFENGGIKIKIFEDDNGNIGNLVDSADSFFQYTDILGKNLNAGNNRFANIDYVFENLNKSSYWVMAQHRNHLPVLSRFVAPYIFEGDNPDTWAIESGWDFTSWNGVKNNFLPNANSNPWAGRYFTAYGNASSLNDDSLIFNTSLIFSSGFYGEEGSGLSLMVAGDINQDLVIDEKDYNLLRNNEATFNSTSDLTGDRFVNADDRILVGKNKSRRISFDTAKIPLEIINDNINENLKNTSEKNILLSSNSSVRLSLDYEIKNKVLYLDVSMESIGEPFYLGSSTLAMSFDTSAIKYRAFSTTTDVPFNQLKNGYLPLRSAPELNNPDAIKNIRTIEIEYDKNSGKDGALLENKKTYLGSFRFDILQNKTIILKWHQSTTINSKDAKLKPEHIKADSIPPIYQYTLNILSPNGGEEYRPKTPIDIKWTYTGNSLIDLEYSYNFGYNWIKINTNPVNVADGKFSWSAPLTYSTTYLIRIKDYDSGSQVDISDSAFSVVSGFAYFLKPVSNDELYMGGTKSQIFWASGGLTSITLLFSSNSGTTWSVISNKVDATKSEIMWTIPKINTKTAIIRMVDNLTKDTIIDSDLFKILSGRIIFQRPGPSEKVYINREYSIRWTNDGADTFDLQLSYDNGETWEYIANNMPAREQIFRWLVPNKQSDFAILRAIWKSDESLEYGRSDTYIITVLNSVSPEELAELGITLYPIPAYDYIVLENKSDIQIKYINILDFNGRELSSQKITLEKEKINLHNLESGIYFIELITQNESKKVKFIKVK